MAVANEHWTAEDYQNYLKGKDAKTGNKYKNNTFWFDGLHFQSQKEFDDYMDHKRLLMAGEIAGFLWQGKLVLIEGGNNNERKAVTYTPDIVTFFNDGTYEVREDKGKKTDAYKIKEKQIKNKFPRVRFKVI